MIGRFLIVSFAAFLLGLIPGLPFPIAPLSAQRPADIVLRNGKILTVDANFSTAIA